MTAANRTFHISWAILAALVLIWLGGFYSFMRKVENLSPAPLDQHTDAIVVLTGGSNRVNTGLDLLKQGFSGQLFISGVDSRVSVEKLVSLWNPEEPSLPCCVTLGHEARNTRQNAQEVHQWLKEQDVSSVRLVTSSYHMPRSMLELSSELPGVRLIPHPVAPVSEYEIKYSLPLAFEEYNKTIFTRLRLMLRR